MINVFQLADNDQSIYYLGQIFGNVGFALSGTGPALLSELFKVFNTIMLVIAVIIVTYVSVIGVMKTAAEGEVLGKGWSTLWVPLRTVLGIAALMPTTTGYCAAQVIIMWFIVQGIGAADTVWSTAIKYFASGGGVMSAPPPNLTDITGQGYNVWTKIVQNLICQAVVTKFSQNNENATAHTQLQSYNEGDAIKFYFGNASNTAAISECGILQLPPDNMTVYQVTHNGQTLSVTGSVNTPGAANFPDKTVAVPSNSYDSDVKVVQSGLGSAGRQEGLLKAYQTALPTLEVIADYYVKQIIDDPNCWSNKDSSNPPKDCTTDGSCNYFDKWVRMTNPNDKCIFGPTTTGSSDLYGSYAWNSVLSMAGSNFLLDVSKLFAGEANNYAVEHVQATQQNQSGTGVTEGVDDVYQRAQVNGWIYAGAYYYTLAGKSNAMQDDYTGFLNASLITLFDTKTAPDFQLNGTVLPPFAPQMQIMQYAPYLTTQARNAIQATTNISGGTLLAANSSAGPSGALSGAASGIQNMWMNLISPTGGNPLANIQHFGHNLLVAADILCITFFGVSLVAALLGTHIVALGFSVSPWYQTALQGLSLLTTALFFLVAYMVTI
jgi:hypothetical protein